MSLIISIIPKPEWIHMQSKEPVSYYFYRSRIRMDSEWIHVATEQAISMHVQLNEPLGLV